MRKKKTAATTGCNTQWRQQNILPSCNNGSDWICFFSVQIGWDVLGREGTFRFLALALANRDSHSVLISDDVFNGTHVSLFCLLNGDNRAMEFLMSELVFNWMKKKTSQHSFVVFSQLFRMHTILKRMDQKKEKLYNINLEIVC